jgi:branched-chain amino acid transport system ATP-binding protein
MESSAPLLQAHDLNAGHHGHPIVEDLNLEVRAGEVVALLGANGAGKSTTLMTLAGHLKPLSGEVRINGVHATSAAHVRAKQGLAFVTEERSVFMRLSTAENLRVGDADVGMATALFPELTPLLGRRAGQLSGGEQQMLTLSRALSRRPKILLADELSLGLAPLIVTRLLEAVRRAARQDGVGVLVVEQHINQALKFADRVYVMQRGQIVLDGAVDEVASRIGDAYLVGAG